MGGDCSSTLACSTSQTVRAVGRCRASYARGGLVVDGRVVEGLRVGDVARPVIFGGSGGAERIELRDDPARAAGTPAGGPLVAAEVGVDIERAVEVVGPRLGDAALGGGPGAGGRLDVIVGAGGGGVRGPQPATGVSERVVGLLVSVRVVGVEVSRPADGGRPAVQIVDGLAGGGVGGSVSGDLLRDAARGCRRSSYAGYFAGRWS